MFRAPRAELQRAIHHDAGPVWQHPDGSAVKGEVREWVERPGTIPELTCGQAGVRTREIPPPPVGATEPRKNRFGGSRRPLLAFRRPCETEEVVPVNVSTWVLPCGVTVGR